jgi:hypothetical protein
MVHIIQYYCFGTDIVDFDYRLQIVSGQFQGFIRYTKGNIFWQGSLFGDHNRDPGRGHQDDD